jgi:hypothetical protein
MTTFPPAKRLPSIARLCVLFHYNPLTGAITHLYQRGSQRAGQPAGTADKSGILRLYVDGSYYRADSIAFALYNYSDPWPKHVIPIDGDTDNLRIANLALSDERFVQPRAKRRRARRPWYEGKKHIRRKDGLWYAHLNRHKKGPFESRAEAIAAMKVMISESIETAGDGAIADHAVPWPCQE